MSASSIVNSRALYARLLTYVRPYWKVFGVALLGMALTAATEPALPALMRELLDGGFAQQNTRPLWFFPALFIGLFVFRGLVSFVGDYAFGWLAIRVVTDLRRDMFNRLVRLPTAYFDRQSSGALISKVAYDVTHVTAAATTALTTVVRDTLVVAGLLGWLFYLNWRLTLITLVMMPCVAAVVRLFSNRIRQAARALQSAMGTITHTLQEAIEAHKVVKIFDGKALECARFASALRQQDGASLRNVVAAAAVPPMVQFFAAVSLSVVIVVALQESASDRATVGGFASFITAMLMLIAPLKRLTDVTAQLQRGLVAAESVFALIDEPAEQDSGSARLGRARGQLDFDRVSFTYPQRDRPVLHDISLSIAPGETVALVGLSGSGKSTLASLVPRFHDVAAGRVLLDGCDIRDLTLDSLRSNIALVSQDVVLFNDTLAANIAYGALRGADMGAIEAAAEAAHALEFIRELPQGFDTVIGDNGVLLSGGQRQRLAIARALLKDAPLLILDEATSALDSESERQVQQALERLMENRTTLVIAHRLSTIERADRIVVLDQGRIVERGRHAELMAAGGIYAHLYRTQMLSHRVDQSTSSA